MELEQLTDIGIIAGLSLAGLTAYIGAYIGISKRLERTYASKLANENRDSKFERPHSDSNYVR